MSSNEYGYIPKAPSQSVGNNDGVFSVNNVRDLLIDEKWRTYGQLEHIQTQTVTSSTASVIFTDIKEDEYNIHFATWNNFQSTVTNKRLVMRFYEYGTEESASVYQSAMQCTGTDYIGATSTSGEDSIFLGTNTATTSAQSVSGHIYIYNAGNGTQYTFTTSHDVGIYQSGSNMRSHFGGAVLPQASVVNQLKFFSTATSNIEHVVISLYGVKEY